MADSYDDIIDLPHWNPSRNHPRMSTQKRAAQFAPFAALSGMLELYESTRLDAEKRLEK